MGAGRIAIITAFVIACGVPPAAAQTADAIFSGWDFHADPIGSRPAGMAGAYVAVADGLRASTVNPAGLTLVPQAEASVTTAPLFIAATVGKGFRSIRGALYWTRTESRSTTLDGLTSLTGFDERGTVESHGAELGAAVGVSFWRIRLGGSAVLSQHEFDGTHVVEDGTGNEKSTRLTVDGDQFSAGTVGAMVDILGHDPNHSNTLRAAVAYRFAQTWDAERRTVTLGAPPVAVEEVPFSRPSTWAVGLSLRALRGVLGTQGFLVAVQADRADLDPLAENAAQNGPPGTFSFRKAWDGRLGTELDFGSPIGGVLKLRAGVARVHPALLRYEGDDARMRALFPGDDAHAWLLSGGASLIVEYMDKGMRLDLDVTGVEHHAQGLRTSVGLVMRF